MTGEEEILALMGKIIAHWNYAEHCSRQIIRKRILGGHVDDPRHLQLSKKPPVWMEEELRDKILPDWLGTLGEPYLRSLIVAFSAARDYRNYYVHGFMATASTSPAQAVIIPSKPHQNRTQAARFAFAADLRQVADHLETLGAFACEVGNTFDKTGSLAKNADETPANPKLPQQITPLPPFQHETLIR